MPTTKKFSIQIDTVKKRETLESIKEARRIARDPNVKAYDVEEALRVLKR